MADTLTRQRKGVAIIHDGKVNGSLRGTQETAADPLAPLLRANGSTNGKKDTPTKELDATDTILIW